MAITATTALQNKLFQVITGNQGVPRGSFISFVGGGIPVQQNSLHWASKQPPYAGDADADAALALSRELNVIPQAASDWTATGSDMAQVYRNIWLTQARVPEVTLTDAQKAERAESQKFLDDNADEYETYRQDWVNANSDLQMAVLAPRDASYLQNLLEARRTAAVARDAFLTKGHKTLYEKAVATVDYFDRVGLQTALQDLINRYDGVYTENLSSTGENFVPIQLYPNNILEPGGPDWNTYSITETDFSRFTSNTSRSFSAGADLNFLFWSAGGSFKWGEQRGYTDITSTSLSVKFDYIRVRLDRHSWFDSFLLMSQSWWWPGAVKSRPTGGLGITFSDGVPPRDTQGQWQMTPVEMIVARNLEVTTKNFNLQDSTFGTQAEADASAGFWIFKTKANYSTSTSSEYKHVWKSKDTLSSPQPQVIAFICQLMPKEPNPAIDLLPDG